MSSNKQARAKACCLEQTIHLKKTIQVNGCSNYIDLEIQHPIHLIPVYLESESQQIVPQLHTLLWVMFRNTNQHSGIILACTQYVEIKKQYNCWWLLLRLMMSLCSISADLSQVGVWVIAIMHQSLPTGLFNKKTVCIVNLLMSITDQE